MIPEDRHEAGCVLDMSVGENLVLDDISACADEGSSHNACCGNGPSRLIDQFEIKTPSPDTPMWALSGGNQQRVVLARVSLAEPDACSSPPSRRTASTSPRSST